MQVCDFSGHMSLAATINIYIYHIVAPNIATTDGSGQDLCRILIVPELIFG